MQSKFSTLFMALLLALGSLPLLAQTPFYTYDFSDETAALSDWTAGGTNDGTGTWEWTDDPGVNVWGGIDFVAPTAENGFLFFNSDANGQNQHEVTLTSPSIDCSDKTQVFLELYTQYIHYNFQYSTVEVGVSIDGGDFVSQEVLEDIEAGDIYESAQRIVLALPDAIGQSDVRIQITWFGFFEYILSVDDVALYEAEPILPNDLVISEVRKPGTFATPISQVDSVFFLGLVENAGTDPQTNVHLRTTILYNDGEPGSSFDQVYQDSTEKTDMLAAGAMDTLIFDNGFLPEAVGTYFVLQTAVADEPDSFPSNNRDIFTFQVTESTFAADDGDLQPFANGLPGQLNSDFWEGGNLYYVPNGDGYEAHEATFVITNPDGDDPLTGESILILLYKIDDDGQPGFTNDDVELVGSSAYSFTADDQVFRTITAPLFKDDGVGSQGIPLEDSTDYLLMLSLPENMGLGYTYQNIIYDVSSVVRNGDDWFLGGFNDPISLIVRMGIRQSDPNAVKEPELADGQISSFPNPAKDFYRIDLDLEKASAVQLQLMNMAGQTILQREYTTLQRDRIDLDVSDLAAGAYLVKIRTTEGVKTLKLTKQ